MSFKVRSIGLIAGCWAAALAAPAMADSEISFGAEAGVGYDSRVSVESLGLTGEGDTTYHLGAGIDWETDLNEALSINAGYDFSLDQYAEYSEFGQMSHNFGAGLRADLGDMTFGLNYNYIMSMLDGDGFLDMQVFSPSVSTFVTDTIYVRGAYSRYIKDFDTADTRDADTDVFNLNAFMFFDNYRSFVNWGFAYENEDANLAEFDYDGMEGSVSLNLAMEGWGRTNTLELGASYRARDYDSITPAIFAKREDEKLELEAALDVPLTDALNLRGEYTYANRSSNLPAADYEEHVLGLLLGIEF